MKKPTIKFWNYLVGLSLIYCSIFVLLLILGVSDLMDTLIPNKDLQHSLREVFSFGMLLFWIYLVFLPLRLTGILRLGKKIFIAMIVLVVITIILFVMTETT